MEELGIILPQAQVSQQAYSSSNGIFILFGAHHLPTTLAQDSPGPGSRPVTASGVVPNTNLGDEEEGKYYLKYKELVKHVEFLKVTYC